MNGTGGLVSAYQLLDHSAQTILRHNLADTNAEMIQGHVISYQQMIKLLEMESVKVKVRPEHEQIAFALLAKRVTLQVLPGPIFGMRRGDIHILEEAGIPYELAE